MTKSREKDIWQKPVTRRQALQAMGAASIFAATGMNLPTAWPGGEKKEQKPPNIVFILSDDHRWDHMSIEGHPFVKTPYMDRLAQQGVLFENAFVTTSLCSPSRASFLTGTYAHTHGVKNNLTPWQNDNTTFMELLKGKGYDTAFIGKWHMPGKLPQLKGVDLFVTFTVQGGQGRYFNCPLIVNGKPEPSRKEYITEELTDRAIEFMEQKRDNPFCLYLSHKAVHHQFLPPKDLAGMYDKEKLDLPKEMDPYVQLSRGNMLYGILGPVPFHYRDYCEALSALDREIGRFMDRLDELGLSENTLVIYAGDNGYFWGEHNLVDKRYAYEEAMRVPMIVRYPGVVKDPGRRAEQMALNVDVAPTVLEAAGVEIPGKVEGRSLLDILKSGDAQGREAVLYEYFRDYPYRVPPHKAVRTKTHKYIKFEGRWGEQLYDLEKDPHEKQNLVGTPEGDKLLPEMRQHLEKLLADPRS
jgi:arylsulfatase A-like enzyme